jgi:syntaxin 5
MMNNGLADLQSLSARSREENKQSSDHSHTVVDSLRGRLKDATAEFKEVLTTRSEVIKHSKDRRQIFSSTSDSEVVPLLKHASQYNAALEPQGTPSFLQAPMSSQHQQLTLSQPQDQYLASRTEALRNVEQTIVELGGIFNKLSEMVVQQGELAIRIDENVDDTLSNVTSAQAQLLKYLNTVSNNRWLVLKVFGVLMAFLLLFIMFLA